MRASAAKKLFTPSTVVHASQTSSTDAATITSSRIPSSLPPNAATLVRIKLMISAFFMRLSLIRLLQTRCCNKLLAKDKRPAIGVHVPRLGCCFAEDFPAAVLQLDIGPIIGRCESDFDFGQRAAAGVPAHGHAPRTIEHQDLPPLALLAVARTLEDPSSHERLDETGHRL